MEGVTVAGTSAGAAAGTGAPAFITPTTATVAMDPQTGVTDAHALEAVGGVGLDTTIESPPDTNASSPAVTNTSSTWPKPVSTPATASTRHAKVPASAGAVGASSATDALPSEIVADTSKAAKVGIGVDPLDTSNVPSTVSDYKPKRPPASTIGPTQDDSTAATPSGSEASTADSIVGKPGFQPASKALLAMHMQARETKPMVPADKTTYEDTNTRDPSSHILGPGASTNAAASATSSLGSSAPQVASTAGASTRAMAVTDAQATDALAAEALDATDGAFPTVDDAIEVGLDVSTSASAGREPGFQPTPKASLAVHIQAPATTTPPL